jgi:hypothetical protein
VVNVGGFSAAILASVLVGGILDLAGRSDVPAYRLAFGCPVTVQLSGTFNGGPLVAAGPRPAARGPVAR